MAAVAALIDELLATHEVCDATYAQVRDVPDDRALIGLAALVGYHTLLAGMLNTFRIGLLEQVPSPFGRT